MVIESLKPLIFAVCAQAIAEVIGNKTDAHIRSFYNNYKRRYNLESVLEEFKQAKVEQVRDII